MTAECPTRDGRVQRGRQGGGWRLGPGPLAQEVRLAPRLAAPPTRPRALLLLLLRGLRRLSPRSVARGGRLRAGPLPSVRIPPGRARTLAHSHTHKHTHKKAAGGGARAGSERWRLGRAAPGAGEGRASARGREGGKEGGRGEEKAARGEPGRAQPLLTWAAAAAAPFPCCCCCCCCCCRYSPWPPPPPPPSTSKVCLLLMEGRSELVIPLELELQMAMSCHRDPGDLTEKTTHRLILLFHDVSCRYQTQVARPGSKLFWPFSHLTGPVEIF